MLSFAAWVFASVSCTRSTSNSPPIHSTLVACLVLLPIQVEAQSRPEHKYNSEESQSSLTRSCRDEYRIVHGNLHPELPTQGAINDWADLADNAARRLHKRGPNVKPKATQRIITHRVRPRTTTKKAFVALKRGVCKKNILEIYHTRSDEMSCVFRFDPRLQSGGEGTSRLELRRQFPTLEVGSAQESEGCAWATCEGHADVPCCVTKSSPATALASTAKCLRPPLL